ncbi:MAG: hypothetical protein NT021_04650 [Sphingobacteriales bacterium]|jgi:hypothetical protein|nr:hypothetical protein [Sphingobacteriales bacterium]
MKKVIAVLALAAFMGAAVAQTTQPKPAAKKEACCKKKDGKMDCKKDCKMACCAKKTETTKKSNGK